jgi:polyphosphate kinase 2 (PPK2 family)
MKLSQKFLIKSGARKLKLKDWDPDYDGGKKREDVENDMVQFSGKVSKLQYKLFAANNQSLLIILQGVDTSGKDGTIRHVMGALNP